MLRNFFLINLILFIIMGFLGFKLYEALIYRAGMPTSSKVEKVKEKNISRRIRPVINEASYSVISQKDLFRPSRSASDIEVETKEEAAPPKNPPKLFGTIILDNEKTAILQDSESKTTKTYKLNDQIAGYTITAIQEDKVELLRGEERFEVKLREDKGITPTRPAAVQPKRSVKERQERQIQPRQRRPRRVRRNVPPPPAAAPQ
jgi:hypothetical protein